MLGTFWLGRIWATVLSALFARAQMVLFFIFLSFPQIFAAMICVPLSTVSPTSPPWTTPNTHSSVIVPPRDMWEVEERWVPLNGAMHAWCSSMGPVQKEEADEQGAVHHSSSTVYYVSC